MCFTKSGRDEVSALLLRHRQRSVTKLGSGKDLQVDYGPFAYRLLGMPMNLDLGQ